MNFFEKIKINPIFRTIRYYPESFKFKRLNKQREEERIKRENGFVDERFLRIKELKNARKESKK